MTLIFDFTDYRPFIKSRFREKPKQGHGQARRLALFLNVHTTLVSQILNSQKSFTVEQALQVAEFLALNAHERDYFLLLVQMDRAGTTELKDYFRRQGEELQKRARELINRMPSEGKLNDSQRALFYSDWLYSAIWQITAIPGFQTIEKIAEHFGLTRTRVREVLDFLVEAGMCAEQEEQYSPGTRAIHLESTSKWIRIHHLNWRQKGIQALADNDQSKLHYSSPMTLSLEDAEVIREMIAKFLEAVSTVVRPSPSEELRCLNIDWFTIKR